MLLLRSLLRGGTKVQTSSSASFLLSCQQQQRILSPLIWSSRIESIQQAAFRSFSSSSDKDDHKLSSSSPSTTESSSSCVRLSKLLSQHATNLAISRNQAERLIRLGEVTMAGRVVRSPQALIDWKDLIQEHNNNSSSSKVVLKVQGKPVLLEPPPSLLGTNKQPKKHKTTQSQQVPRVWAVHKLNGEVVSDNDPQGRPAMMARLAKGGVGKEINGKQRRRFHLKPIGRLDMTTEGLILVTNDGEYAREMELPSNQLHRVYRCRVHGRLTSYKLDRIRQGRVRYENVRYGPMAVAIERRRKGTAKSTNTWLQITSTEGKNRQIRKVFEALGVTVTRLIRVAYGDYELQSIPPGMALSVPYKPIDKQKARGPIRPTQKQQSTKSKDNDDEEMASPIRWIRSVQ